MTNLKDLKELDNLSPEERKLALQILEEYSLKGKSQKLEDLKYKDYEEMPVDIETFLYDKQYLGNGLINAEGKFTVFPYWVETLKKIFPNNIDTAYNTLVLTGGIGLGKSFMAVLCIAYLLHRMLCLKDPYLYYGLQPIDKITFSFINVTIDAAKGVGWDKIQQLFQSSPWFMNHGTVSGRSEKVWVPQKRIELVVGSSNNVIIGRALYCLDGDTIIKTTIGDRKIKDLVDKPINVISRDENGNETISSTCTVKPTISTTEEYQIELEDGSIIKCTPNHRFMLKNGLYKEAQYLTENDELMDLHEQPKISYKELIENIINSRGQWNIPEGDYFEAHHILPTCKGGSGEIRNGSGILQKHPNIIWMYPEEHYEAHKLLALENPKDAKLVWAWYAMASKELNGRKYIVSKEDYALLKKLHRESVKDFPFGINPETGRGYNYQVPLSEDAKAKISKAMKGKNKGVPKSEETKRKMLLSWETRDKQYLRDLKPTKDLKRITDGVKNTFIKKEDPLPEGFRYGMTTKKDHSGYNNSWTEERRQQQRERFQGEKGPRYGKGYLTAGIKNGGTKYIFTYKGIDYFSRSDLVLALRPYYPKLTDITIKQIMENDYTSIIANKYKEVIQNLSWRLKNEDKIN